MSMTALLLGTRDHLRFTLKLPSEECEIMDDGMPPAIAGERFVAVNEGEWASNSYESLDEYFGIDVTISMRAAKFPRDKLGRGLLADMAQKSGLVRLAEWVRAAIHSNYDLMDRANAILGPAVNGFVEPLRLAGPGKLRAVGPSWYSAEADADSDDVTGLVMVMPFQRARRVQVIDNQMSEFVAG